MVNELLTAFNEITELRALPQEIIIEAVESALISAYRRDAKASAAQKIEAKFDLTTSRARIFVEKEVVEEMDENFNNATEVTLEKARFYDPECQVGDIVMVQVENPTRRFDRIAAQTAKQVLLQKIREAERNSLYEEFISREGDIITGSVQSLNANVVTLSLGRAEAILPRAQQIPGERYRQHEKLRIYVMEVKKSSRGPQIVVSRSHRNMLRRLLEYEVPEIYNGQVEIKNIAREAGYRSKVAVVALQEGVDPVGACVGMRGIRIQNIVKELHDEKIDVIEWNPDPIAFIAKALSPARVGGVYLEDDSVTGRTAVVVVPDDQLSLAIGREGQNARLAAKLTGWRIDIKSVTETVQGALQNIDLPPLSNIAVKYPDLLQDVERIIEKKQANMTVMPEEYNTLNKFADIVEKQIVAEREEERRAEQEQIEAIKATLPQEMFEVPIIALGLSDEVTEAIESLGTVGDVMLWSLLDETQITNLLGHVAGDPMSEIQSALDMLMMPEDLDAEPLVDVEIEETPDPETEEPEAVVETELEAAVEVVEVAEVEPEDVTEEAVAVVEEVDEEEPSEDEAPVLMDAFGGAIVESEPVVEEVDAELELESEPDAAVTEEGEEGEESVAFEDLIVNYDNLGDDDEYYGKSSKKKKKKKRQLIYDEESGQVFSKKRRKGNRKRSSWEDDIDF